MYTPPLQAARESFVVHAVLRFAFVSLNWPKLWM